MSYVNLPDGIYTRAHVHHGIGSSIADASVLQPWLPQHERCIVHVEVKDGVARSVTKSELEASKAPPVEIREEVPVAVAAPPTPAPAPEPEPPEDPEPVREIDALSLSFKQLKAALKAKGLNAAGRKAELRKRLLASQE